MLGCETFAEGDRGDRPSLLTVREAARQIAERRITAEALVTAYLDRIEAREAVVGAWQYLDREQALATARQRDAEPPRGPLHGVPIAVKDLIDTRDMPTAMGRRSTAATGRPRTPLAWRFPAPPAPCPREDRDDRIRDFHAR